MIKENLKILLVVFIALFIVSCNKEGTNKILCSNALISEWEVIPSVTSNTLSNVSFYDENHGVISGSRTTIMTTDDGGLSWKNGNISTSQTFHHSYILNPNEIFACRNGLFKSTDGGVSYSEIGNFMDSQYVTFNIHFFNSDKGLIYNGRNILGTEDGGLNWSIKSEGSTTADEFFFISDEVGFIAGGSTSYGIGGGIISEGKILKTLDGGDSWELVHTNDWEIISIYFINDEIGYYTNYKNELFKSLNGGLTWELINANLPTRVHDIVYLDECNGYFAGQSGIYRTENEGIDWELDFENESEILSLDIKSNSSLFAVGRDGLMLSKD